MRALGIFEVQVLRAYLSVSRSLQGCGLGVKLKVPESVSLRFFFELRCLARRLLCKRTECSPSPSNCLKPKQLACNQQTWSLPSPATTIQNVSSTIGALIILITYTIFWFLIIVTVSYHPPPKKKKKTILIIKAPTINPAGRSSTCSSTQAQLRAFLVPDLSTVSEPNRKRGAMQDSKKDGR